MVPSQLVNRGRFTIPLSLYPTSLSSPLPLPRILIKMIQKGFTSCLSVLPKRIPCSIHGCSSASLTAIRSREQHLGHLATTPSRSLHTSKATLSAQSTNANKNTTPTTDPFKLKPIPPTGETVELDFELYQPPQNAKSFQTDAKAIVVCHGLL